jgi:hypothetical protein
MVRTEFPYKATGWALFILALAIFMVYHISHGFPGLDIMLR